jgi:hypothetical protein
MTTIIKAKEIQWVNVLERAVATTLQSFLAVWMMTDCSTLRAAAVSAVASGLSVLKSAVAEWNSKLEKL